MSLERAASGKVTEEAGEEGGGACEGNANEAAPHAATSLAWRQVDVSGDGEVADAKGSLCFQCSQCKEKKRQPGVII